MLGLGETIVGVNGPISLAEHFPQCAQTEMPLSMMDTGPCVKVASSCAWKAASL